MIQDKSKKKYNRIYMWIILLLSVYIIILGLGRLGNGDTRGFLIAIGIGVGILPLLFLKFIKRTIILAVFNFVVCIIAASLYASGVFLCTFISIGYGIAIVKGEYHYWDIILRVAFFGFTIAVAFKIIPHIAAWLKQSVGK
jgi:hypothetical protein